MQSQLILIRHGQSLANEQRTREGKLAIFDRYGDRNVPLSKRGEAQAVALGNNLNTIIAGERTRAFCSPYKRAFSTMDIALSQVTTENAIFRFFNENLREKEYFGLRSGEAKDFYSSSNSETSADLCKRLEIFARRLRTTIRGDFRAGERNPVKYNLVFMHGESMRALHLCLTGASPDDYMSWGNPYNCSAYHYIFNDPESIANPQVINGPTNFLDLSV